MLPTFLAGPFIGWARDRHQWRRKVRLTVHRAYAVSALASFGGQTIEAGGENYYITVTNASPKRDVVVTHVWLDTVPPVQVFDRDLPRRLRYNDVWETNVSVDEVPPDATDVEWLARCQITPDDKIVKSRPRRRVPPFGAVPRGGAS